MAHQLLSSACKLERILLKSVQNGRFDGTQVKQFFLFSLTYKFYIFYYDITLLIVTEHATIASSNVILF